MNLLPGTPFITSAAEPNGLSYLRDQQRDVTITFYRVRPNGTVGAFLRGPVTGVTEVTNPADSQAAVKSFRYLIPNAAGDDALPFGDLYFRLIVPVTGGPDVVKDVPVKIVSNLNQPAYAMEGPDSFNPWLTQGDASTGIAAPTVAIFPYLYNPQNTPTPGFPPIWASFSDIIEGDWFARFQDTPDDRYLSVWRSQLMDYNGRVKVHGEWRFADSDEVNPLDAPYGVGSALLFEPSEAILPNNRYTIHVGRGLPMQTGHLLENGFEWHFMSRLSPFYADPYKVRSRLGEYGGKVSDEQLYYEIFNASVDANRETMPYSPGMYMGGPAAQSILGWQPVRTHALNRFAEVQSVINITKALINKYLDIVDRKHQGLDFATEIEDGLIKNLNLVLKTLTQEREPFYSEISKRRNNVRTARPGSRWPGGQGGTNWGPNDSSFRGRRRF